MTTHNKYVSHGFGTVRPYIYGPSDLPTFIQNVFGGEELERVTSSKGAHVEIKIGDSVLIVEALIAPENFPLSSVYVYVPDVDGVYQHALQLSATSVATPDDKPYQERSAGFKDSFGNTWWISTYQPN